MYVCMYIFIVLLYVYFIDIYFIDVFTVQNFLFNHFKRNSRRDLSFNQMDNPFFVSPHISKHISKTQLKRRQLYVPLFWYFGDSDSASRPVGHPNVWFTLTAICRAYARRVLPSDSSAYALAVCVFGVAPLSGRRRESRGAFNLPSDVRQLRSDADDAVIVSTVLWYFSFVSRRSRNHVTVVLLDIHSTMDDP